MNLMTVQAYQSLPGTLNCPSACLLLFYLDTEGSGELHICSQFRLLFSMWYDVVRNGPEFKKGVLRNNLSIFWEQSHEIT